MASTTRSTYLSLVAGCVAVYTILGLLGGQVALLITDKATTYVQGGGGILLKFLFAAYLVIGVIGVIVMIRALILMKLYERRVHASDGRGMFTV